MDVYIFCSTSESEDHVVIDCPHDRIWAVGSEDADTVHGHLRKVLVRIKAGHAHILHVDHGLVLAILLRERRDVGVGRDAGNGKGDASQLHQRSEDGDSPQGHGGGRRASEHCAVDW